MEESINPAVIALFAGAFIGDASWVGTLITAPASLNVPAALIGLAVVIVSCAVIVSLI